MEQTLTLKKDSSTQVTIGKWRTNVSPISVRINRPLIDWALGKLHLWVNNFPTEGSLAENLYGVPSILASLNCVIDEAGRQHLISVSPNPSNIGIASLADSRLKDGLHYWMSLYGDLKGVYGRDDQIPDDELWIQHIDAKEASLGFVPFVVRGRVGGNFNGLREKSLSPIVRSHNNYYGLAMGLWRETDYSGIDYLPWNQGFSLRHTNNLGRIFIYSPSLRSANGARTERKIENLLVESPGKMYVQPFIRPMDSPIKGEFMVYKLYFGFFPDVWKYGYLGGVWMSRKNLVVHGTPETTFGPLSL